MSDLIFYGNITIDSLSVGEDNLVSKSVAESNSCSFSICATEWVSGALSNSREQRRLYNGEIYRCTATSLTASTGGVDPETSANWSVTSFAPKATTSVAGLIKPSTGLSISSGLLSLNTASSSVLGGIKVGAGFHIADSVLSYAACRRYMKTQTGMSVTINNQYEVYYYAVTMAGQLTFSLSASHVGNAVEFELVLVFGSTVYNVTFPSTVTWGNQPPAFQANTTYIFKFTSYDRGASWFGECLNKDSDANALRFTIQVSANNVVNLTPSDMSGASLANPVTIDWGDGTVSTYSKATFTHTYASAGTRQIKVSSSNGLIPVVPFKNLGTKLLTVDLCDVQWIGSPTPSAREMFYGCSNLTTVPETLFSRNTDITDFAACFASCSSLQSVAVDLFDTIPSADFVKCFFDCAALTPSTEAPYVPQIWEKDTMASLGTSVGGGVPGTPSSYAGVPNAEQYVPATWGGTMEQYTTRPYNVGDWVYYYDNGVPRVYTCIESVGSNQNAPTNEAYWVKGYVVRSNIYVIFKRQKSGFGQLFTTINYKGTEYTYSSGPYWTYGVFDYATWNAMWQQADSFMMSSLSLTNGVLTLTMGDGANVYPLDNLAKGDVLTFGGFVESQDDGYWYATSSTYTKS